MLGGLKAWFALVGAAGALAGTGFVFVTEVIDPGAGSSHGESDQGGSSDGVPLIIRAIGDSVTGGFGYRPDGSQISVKEFLGHCISESSDPDCQDPDGVAYPAQFADRQDDTDFANAAVSGSTPADWLGEGRLELSDELESVVEADPDVTAVTVGANPLLEAFLSKSDRICGSWPFGDDARKCIRGALLREMVLPRLARIYASLLDTPADGRNGLVVVFQYPETRPVSAFGVRTEILIEELRSTIDRAAAAVREADPDRGRRLIVAEPGPFLAHGCFADAPWILKVDTCVHPNVAGHEQLADVLEGVLRDRPREVVETEVAESERFAVPGTSCGVLSVDDPYTSDPGDAFESRLGVTSGRLPCGEIESLFERYATDRSPCVERGAGTCWREYGRWRCVAPTYSLYPANFTCVAVGDEERISEVAGLYVKETTPTTGTLYCGNTRQGGGPFEIEANFDCRSARMIARIATADFNFGFLCDAEATSIESSRTECHLDGARVEWINGA
jgi:lysophospholipase L1-like esterase